MSDNSGSMDKFFIVSEKLTDRNSWWPWYHSYRAQAQTLGLWGVANQDEDPIPNPAHARFKHYTTFKEEWAKEDGKHTDGLDNLTGDELTSAYNRSI